MTLTVQHFEIHPSSGVPIYRQMMEQILAMIASGIAKPGDQLPSVRELSSTLEVNMMTISKAYSLLERDGVLLRQRGVGMRIAEQTQTLTLSQRKAELKPLAMAYLSRGRQLGMTDTQLMEMIQNQIKELSRESH